MIRLCLAALTVAAQLAPARAADRAAHPLFSSEEPMRVVLRGPIDTIRRNAARATDAHDATLTLFGAAGETHPIRLAARGLTRRQQDVCSFPPLRVEFVAEPPRSSLFRGQRRLKLVTHCRPGESFQQHVLVEYAAYRLFNALTPLSLRVRLATIDYFDMSGEPFASRLGFFIEDVDDAARRNGLVEIEAQRVASAALSPRDAGRYAVFQYMIGNLDWSMTVAPPGDGCCHNSKLLGATADARQGLVPIPYDFDHSGLVDAPYATPPPQVRVASVRVRRYRGYCVHNAEAQTAAAEARAARPSLEAALESVPQLDPRSRRRTMRYLAAFFADVATPEAVAANLLRTCLS